MQEIASSNNLNVISSSNTGPTIQINKKGKIIDQTKFDEKNYLVSEIYI